MTLQFIINNWYLFLALVVILFLLAMGPLTQYRLDIKNASVTQAVLLLNREGAVVVDVCEPNEYQTGHIPGAINLPLSALPKRLPELDKHKSKPVIVACRSGNRSMKAAAMLRKQGFATVYNLSGGLLAWEKESLPVER
jgi:rhodanese-related sulfurtransferase